MKISCSTNVRCNNRLKKFHSKTIIFDASCLSTFKPCNFIKGRLQHRCFPVSIAKFLRKSFFTEDILFCFFWLLLAILYKLPTSAYKVMTPWTQDVNWTSYVRSIYVLCPVGRNRVLLFQNVERCSSAENNYLSLLKNYWRGYHKHWHSTSFTA